MVHPTLDDLQAGLEHIRRSPATLGRLERIVRRPAVDTREVDDAGVLDVDDGLVGDSWRQRASRRTADGSAEREMQLTVMNARVAALVAGSDDRWALAGDQLYVDLDLSVENLPAGARLEIGPAVIEVSAEPHLGCAKFAARYGRAALRFVNSPAGRALRLRGLNARVVTGGTVRVGDAVRKLD